jgi:hypothetical protein
MRIEFGACGQEQRRQVGVEGSVSAGVRSSLSASRFACLVVELGGGRNCSRRCDWVT